MAWRILSPDERKAVADLAGKVGPTEAGRRTGHSTAAVAGWCRDHGVKCPTWRQRNMAAPPSPAQRKVLEFVRAYVAERGVAPTRHEIKAGVGYTNPGTVQRHLAELASKGLLRLVPNTPRGIHVRDSELKAEALARLAKLPAARLRLLAAEVA